jgi:hypothetical protein
MSAPIAKGAYAPTTPNVALEHSVCLATKPAEIIRSLSHVKLKVDLDFFAGLWDHAVEPVLPGNDWGEGLLRNPGA